MTPKRFELIWETDEMCNVFDNDLDVNSTISVEEVVDLLNELHEENMLLKKYRNAIWNCDSSKIIRVNANTGEVDLIDKESKKE